MSLSRPLQPIDRIRAVYGEYDGSYFPLLALPSELIAGWFSHLPIEERMRARVNKRLDGIELKSKYRVPRLVITEQSIASGLPCARSRYSTRRSLFEQRIVFFEEKCYSTACIERLTKTASIGNLSISLSGCSKFQLDVYNLIKNFNVGIVNLDFQNTKVEKEVMTGTSFFGDLARNSKGLFMATRCEHVTHLHVYKVHQIMMFDRGAKLRHFRMEINKRTCLYFLTDIGITNNYGAFSSYWDINIEVYVLEEFYRGDDDKIYRNLITHIFNWHIEIVMHQDIFEDGIEMGKFELRYHGTRESLENAKDGLTRIEVAAEID